MLPPNGFSTVPHPGTFLSPDDSDRDLLQDFEYGGIAINDPSQGLRVKVWSAYYTKATKEVRLRTLDGAVNTLMFSVNNLTELSFAFDQNMQPVFAYMQDGVLRFRWFDSVPAAIVTTQYAGATSPFVTLDDKRAEQTSNSDILLAYLRAGSAYYRLQRERFAVEHAIPGAIPSEGVSRITNFGMTDKNRVELLIQTVVT